MKRPGMVLGPNQSGFTLTEVMVATMMTTAILAAGLGALTVTQKTTRISGQVGNTQATARTALDMITADLKLAGFGMRGLTAPVGNCHINGTPSALVPNDNFPAGGDFGPDSISMVVPMTNSMMAVGPVWQLAANAGPVKSPGFTAITMPANATTAMGNAIPGGAAALVGMSVSLGGVAGSVIAPGGVNSGGLSLNPGIIEPVAFGVGTQVYLLQCITYQVIPPPDALNLCQGAAPCLVRGVAPGVPAAGTPPSCNVVNPNPANPHPCVPIMDGVEDLQLAYACDGCDPRANNGNPDLQLDDLDLSNQYDQADFITNRNWFGTAGPYGTYMTPSTIRLVQVNIVARETRADQGTGEALTTAVHSIPIPVVSDHNHATGVFAFGDNTTPAQQAAYFQFRRRILARTIELRNQRF